MAERVRTLGPQSDNISSGVPATLHATSVSLDRQAALIIGASGSGKSALALELISRGANLIADDMTRVTVQDGAAIALPPPTRKGQIEARGLGILDVGHGAATPIRAVIDLDHIETDRLPPMRSCLVLGCDIPLFHKVERPYFAAAILAYLGGERIA